MQLIKKKKINLFIMTDKYILSPDNIIHFKTGICLISNPKTRTHVAINTHSIRELEKINNGVNQKRCIKLLENSFGFDATRELYGLNGLHDDFTGIDIRKKRKVFGKKLFNLLLKRKIIIEKNYKKYFDYFSSLESVLDKNHLGNFHQRIGQFLLLNKRKKPDDWKWWHDQKFSKNGLSVKNGPYKIQEIFVKHYFKKKKIKDLEILDFGCGNGFFSNFFHTLGAKVTAVDLSRNLINLAKKNYSSKIKFIYFKNINQELLFLSKMKKKFDVIFMQDTFLLFFDETKKINKENIINLFNTLNNANKSCGELFLVEPNPIFWLAGRYGDEKNPNLIITEYKKKKFNVSPLLTEIINITSKSGYGLTEYLHPDLIEKNNYKNPNKNFFNQFCIWDFYKFKKIKKNEY